MRTWASANHRVYAMCVSNLLNLELHRKNNLQICHTGDQSKSWGGREELGSRPSGLEQRISGCDHPGDLAYLLLLTGLLLVHFHWLSLFGLFILSCGIRTCLTCLTGRCSRGSHLYRRWLLLHLLGEGLCSRRSTYQRKEVKLYESIGKLFSITINMVASLINAWMACVNYFP